MKTSDDQILKAYRLRSTASRSDILRLFVQRGYAQINNTKRVTFSNVPVKVLLYDVDNNVFATGETIIPFLDKEEQRLITFTWTEQFQVAPNKIRVYPILDPFSPQ